MVSVAWARLTSASIAKRTKTIDAETVKSWPLRSVTSGNGVPFLVLEDADSTTLAGRLEINRALAGGEDRVVAADTDAVAGPEAGAALADDDLAAADALAGEDLDAEHVRVRFAAVAAGAEAFLVRHA